MRAIVPRLCVVFDTNVYRTLAKERFRALRIAETSHSVIGFANYATVTELLAHLATPETREGRIAASAADRLLQHCTEYDGATNVVRFVAPALGQISRYLFGMVPPSEDDHANAYGRLLGEWVTTPGRRQDLAPALEEIASRADQARDAYVATLWKSVVLTLAPEATAWFDVKADSQLQRELLKKIDTGVGRQLLARNLAQQAAVLVSRHVPDTDMVRIALHVQEVFGLVIEFRHRIIRHVIAEGPDMSRRSRANGAFDLHVCGVTSGIATLRGAPVILVTDDGDILESAQAIDQRDEIVTLDDYERLLATDGMQFDLRMEGLLRRQDVRRQRLAAAV
jgi:hypothetical protein